MEENYAYPGIPSTNQGVQDQQPDLESCRNLCQTKNARYFTWRSPSNGDQSTNYQCWCKNELKEVEKKYAYGVFTGDTKCDGKLKVYKVTK